MTIGSNKKSLLRIYNYYHAYVRQKKKENEATQTGIDAQYKHIEHSRYKAILNKKRIN